MNSKHLIGNKHRVGKIPWNKGKKGVQPVSLETRRKLSLRKIGNKNRLGAKQSVETRKKISDANMGELSHSWKGGITPQNRLRRNRVEYQEWRSKVFERDNWTCQTCRVRGVLLHAHHIKRWSKYPELRFVLENGVTLCVPCHELTDNYKGRV